MAGGGAWQAEMAVVTPESVSFSYEVAGIGSRFLALAVDHLIQIAFLIAFNWAVLRTVGVGASQYLPLLLVMGAALFLLGYFIFFEILWDGKTPGKRLLHLRVVRNGGYGLTALESILRNLLRIVDFLPFVYGFGLLSMFLSEKSRRLGDFVAGTVVVKDRSGRVPAPAAAAAREALTRLPAEIQTLLRGRLERFSPEELGVMRAFILRRGSLTREARASLGERLKRTVLARCPEAGALALPGELLVEAVVAAHEERMG
ncbi:MAG: RDD family protein [Patescibacteria group bacterium]